MTPADGARLVPTAKDRLGPADAVDPLQRGVFGVLVRARDHGPPRTAAALGQGVRRTAVALTRLTDGKTVGRRPARHAQQIVLGHELAVRAGLERPRRAVPR